MTLTIMCYMEQKFRETLALNLKIARIKNGITQDKLGEITDISTKHITKIEKAKVTPSIYLVYKMSKALNISIDELLK